MAQPPESSFDGTINVLVKERLSVAMERLKAAELSFQNEDYATSANRSYYAIFKAMIAIHAIDGNSFRRHKDAIAQFNKNYVAAGIFPSEYGRKIHRVANLRNVSDYVDFKTPTKEEAEASLAFAEEFVQSVRTYCEQRFEKRS